MALLQGNDDANVLTGGAGDDTIDGAGGKDLAVFHLPEGVGGTFRRVDAGDGTIILKLVTAAGEEDVFIITPGAQGAATVQGVGVAAYHGTDSIANVEEIHFHIPHDGGGFDPTKFLALALTPAQYGDYVGGSINADTIDLSAFPGAVNSNGDLGDDSIVGTAASNYLEGGAGADTVDGGGGDDVVIGGAGNDLLDGGAGTLDTARYALPADTPGMLRAVDTVDGLVVELVQDDGNVEAVARIVSSNGTITVEGLGRLAHLGTDTLTNVEDVHVFVDVYPAPHAPGQYLGLNVTPRQYGDFVAGSIVSDTVDLSNFPGALSANGNQGADTVIGTADANNLYGGDGDDSVSGGDGNDFLAGEAGDDQVDGGAGNDIGAFVIPRGTAGTLRSVGTSEGFNVELVQADGTAETIFAVTFDAGVVTVQGLGSMGHLGADTFTNVEDLHFFIETWPEPAGPGQFVGVKLAPEQYGEWVNGTDRADVLNVADFPGAINLDGRGGDDQLTGASGDNYFIGGGGNDVIDGRGGNRDIAAFHLERGTQGSMRVVDGPNGTLLVELVQADGSAETVFAVTLTGSGGAIVEGVGRAASLGTDTVTNVNDLHFFVQNYPDPNLPEQFTNILVAPSQFGEWVSGSEAADVIDLAAFPGAINADGNRGDDTIVGSSANNYLIGGEGNDTIDGVSGTNDIASYQLDPGTPGTMALVQGTGADAGKLLVQLVNGGIGETFLVVTPAGDGAATVQGVGIGAHFGTDTLANINELHIFVRTADNSPSPQFVSVRLAATQYGNNVVGTDAGDTISLVDYPGATQANGMAGNDTLIGDDNANSLFGNVGDDEVYGRGGNDTLIGGPGNDRVDGEDGHDFLNGLTGDDQLSGGAGNDNLRGEDGTDLLSGGDGNDLLNGGRGVDSFDGGAENPNAPGFVTLPAGDRITFYNANATSGVIADLRTGIISNDGYGNAETMSGIESLGGDTAFADQFYGNDVRNVLVGGAGDTLMGFGDDDFIQTNAAAAVVDGGDGTDRMSLTSGGGWLSPDANGDGLAEFTATMASGWFVNLATGFVSDGYGNTGSVTGIEEVAGTELNDTIWGNGDANLVIGGAGDDSLRGEGGNDRLVGGDGSDLLRGGEGVDSFDGGADMPGSTTFGPGTLGDRISFYEVRATSGVVADLRTGIISNDGFGNVETMTGIESIGADTAFADLFYGNDVSNLLWGGRGDTLSGFGGEDIINMSGAAIGDGGDGVDRLVLYTDGHLVADTDGDGAADHSGPMSNGWFVNLATGFVVDGFGFTGSVANVEDVFASDLNDFVIGNGANNRLTGNAGDDHLRGEGGNDVLIGGDGSDLLRGGAGVDSFDGGSEDLDSTTFGDGRIGDRISFFEVRATSGVIADLATGIISNDGFGNVETMTGIESLGGDTAFADQFYGNDSRNVLFGSRGDTIATRGGDDGLFVTGATALADGGDGIDTLALGSAGQQLPDTNGDGVSESSGPMTAGWVVDLGTGYLQDGFGFTGSVANVEHVEGAEYDDVLLGNGAGNRLIGGDGDDDLLGFGGDDRLEGGAGSEYMFGGAGVDVLLGEAGDDYLIGGAGDDLIDGGEGLDRAGYSRGATNGVTVDLRLAGMAQDTGLGVDTLIGIEHVSGTRFSDTITGDDGDNWLWGGSDGSGVTGDDTISGGGGNDLVEVGAGNHVLDGGDGVDTLSIYGNLSDVSAAGVTASLALQGTAQDTEQGVMIFTGFENLMGSGHDDLLTGDDHANTLAGYSGADQLLGGGGADLLLGDGAVFPDTGDQGNSGPLGTELEPGGTAGNDVLDGGDGDDALVGGGGNDQLVGGIGTDTAFFYVGEEAGGTFSVVAGEGGDAGKMLVMLTTDAGSERVAEITSLGMSLLVTGVGAGAHLGTDTVASVERLIFSALPADATASMTVPGFASFNVGATAGRVADGYVAGATVFVDNNRNGLLDAGESTAVTDGNGNFELLNFGDGPIVAVGGTNTDTGLPNQMVLQAPNDASIINPLTTLVHAVAAQSGASVEEAEAQVKAALNLDPALALLSTDVLAAAGAGDPAALQAQKAAAMVVTIVVAASDAASDSGVGEALAVDQLASLITAAAGSEGIVDVTDPGVIEQVVIAAAPDVEDPASVASDLSTAVTQIDQAETLEEVSDAQAEALLTGNDLDNRLVSGEAGDTLTGSGGHDVLLGNGGDDYLLGGDGDDLLNGGDGFDRLYGGAGNDTFVLSGGTPTPGAKGGLAIDAIFDFGEGDTLLLDGVEILGSELFGNMNAAEKSLGVDLDGLPKHAGSKTFVTMIYGDSDDDGQADFAVALVGVKVFEEEAAVRAEASLFVPRPEEPVHFLGADSPTGLF